MTYFNAEINQLKESLSKQGYEIIEGSVDCSLFYPGVTHGMSVGISYGPHRRDCKGGFIFVRKDGTIQYDFFVGGSKYGRHLNSFSGPLDDGFVNDFPVVRILNFLSLVENSK